MFSHLSSSDVRSAMSFVQAASVPTGAEWVYEYNWSGERVLAAKEGASVHVKAVASRRDLTNRFPAIAAAIAKLNAHTAIVDGVIRSLDPKQLPVFGRAVGAIASGAALIRFIAVDLLWHNQDDVRRLPLGVRKERLRQLAEGTPLLVSNPVPAPAPEVLEQAARAGADGVMAKRRDSRYRPFARNGDWVRVPVSTGHDSGEPSPAAANKSGGDIHGIGPGALRLGPAW